MNNLVLATAIFIMLITSCTEKKSADIPPPAAQVPTQDSTQASPPSLAPPTPTPAPATAPTPSPAAIPAANKNALAEVREKRNNVSFRAHDESIWSAVDIGRQIERFDALQTQASSMARVLYRSGSELDVKESTLLVFDHDPGAKKKKSEDRVIVKNGELVGTTKTELWVFTNAGLVQIKSGTPGRAIAKTSVKIESGKKLNVKVDAGKADVIVKSADKFEKIEVATKSDLQYESKVSLLDDSQKKDVKSEIVPAEVVKVAAAAEQPVPVVKADLLVESPKEDLSISAETFEIQGKLTGPGAKLLINGELVSPNADFAFKKQIKLTPGANLVVFQLIRSDGSVQFARKTIKRTGI